MLCIDEISRWDPHSVRRLLHHARHSHAMRRQSRYIEIIESDCSDQCRWGVHVCKFKHQSVHPGGGDRRDFHFSYKVQDTIRKFCSIRPPVREGFSGTPIVTVCE
jgi:hypothetical protein